MSQNDLSMVPDREALDVASEPAAVVSEPLGVPSEPAALVSKEVGAVSKPEPGAPPAPMNTAAGDKLPALELKDKIKEVVLTPVESKELAAYGASLRLAPPDHPIFNSQKYTFEHAVQLQDVGKSQVALTSGRDTVNVFISVAGRYLDFM
jgi:hypothetical protein